MAMPSMNDIKTAIRNALANRNETADAEEIGTVARLVRGRLRTTFGALPPLNQVAPKMTDLFLLGRRDMPPDAHRPQLRPLVRSACKKVGAPVPSQVEIETLVNVAIGWMNDHSLPTPPGGRAVVLHHVVGLYLAGG